MKHLILIAILSFIIGGCTGYTQSEFPVLEGAYLGQTPPGNTPTIFAPGIVSMADRYEHGIAFSPNLDEVYYSANREGESAEIYFSTLRGNSWTPIEKAQFTGGEKAQEMQPFVSADNQRIYFTAYNADFTDNKIWYVDRLDDGWDNAVKLSSPINHDEVFYSIQARNGDLYYFSLTKNQSYYAPYDLGRFSEVAPVDIAFGVHAAISPSQDYIVVNARNREDPKRQDGDIYVYFKQPNGSWGSAINLGAAVNSTFPETVPNISPDGKYLFFSRYNEPNGESNFYWVSTEVIEAVRPAPTTTPTP
ncbi:MAG: hypothetical protein ABNH02_03880 [Pseudomonadales bacterium]|jgi:Tol biopolymer transport system component